MKLPAPFLALPLVLSALPAGASTLVRYDLSLRFDGYEIADVSVDDGSGPVALGTLTGASPYPEVLAAFDRFLPGLSPGDRIALNLAARVDDRTGDVTGLACALAGQSCLASWDPAFWTPDPAYLHLELQDFNRDYTSIFGATTAGSRIEMADFCACNPDYFSGPGFDADFNYTSDFFTVVSSRIATSVVPAPAAAATLPVALGLLGLVGWRRRQYLRGT